MSKTIVIVRATGIQGSSVASTFLRFPEWRVRGITRNPLSTAAQDLVAVGVEMIKADIDDPQSLLPAFEGTTEALASVDPSRTPDELNEYAYNREVAQGINIAEVAASPAAMKTLERFVYSSLQDPRKWSRGKYTIVYHYNSKVGTVRAIQTRFPDLAARMSTVQQCYASMWKAFPSMAPQKQHDGSFLAIGPVNPNMKFHFVVAHWDTGLFVKALIDLPPTKALLGYKQVSKDEFFKGVPQELKHDLGDTYNFIGEFGYTGGDPEVLTPEQVSSISHIFLCPLLTLNNWTLRFQSH
ncbi:uncharacterized protein ATNIH1004_005535 [Aspergillus tanneri]|uniref:NmrA-like domain-containing protein n=1 Tax=Aspergillus tanneri TaxID=1220188 RepID=A0A5M9MNI9_9EURO|nr:uncharacterized protein ATNIH1004_005535 [Aspergillus tanneri]KAA8646860.1 hypothetical protein ATNIH1004_005535 [Aspergillus tanneri]